MRVYPSLYTVGINYVGASMLEILKYQVATAIKCILILICESTPVCNHGLRLNFS